MTPPVYPNLTIIAPIWGETYWDKWGEEWLAQMVALDPQPEQWVAIVDRKRDNLPRHWNQVVKPDVSHATWFNHGVANTTTEWVMACGIDDGMPADALDGLVLDGDVVVGPLLASDGKVYQPTAEKYETILEASWYPMTGWSVYRTEIARKYPLRGVVWDDWHLWFEYRQNDVNAKFDTKIRQHYRHHANQVSRASGQIHRERIEQMRVWAKEKRIIPGIGFPPELQ